MSPARSPEGAHSRSAEPVAAEGGPRIAVEHDASRSCFRADVEGLQCVAEYRMAGSVMQMTHTEVPPGLEGRGIAAALVREALAHAARHGLKVEPLCSYVRGYMRCHPESHALLAQ
jgi:predicted GNAT family acetyltransferase